jgi:gas vesicle protein
MGQDPDRIREEIARTREQYSSSDETDRIRGEIDETRAEMGATVQALGHKADVRTRVRESVSEKKDAFTSSISNAATAVTRRADAVVSSVTGAVPDKETAMSGAQRVGISRENPLGLAVAGAAVGFLVGTLLPSTRVEDERMGEVADQVKDKAREAGNEAVERGKEVAHEALDSAKATTREAAEVQGQELVSTVQESAREVTSGAQQEAGSAPGQ